MLDINWNPTRRDLRQFAGLVVPAFIGLFGVILGWQTGSWALPRTMWTVALVIAVIGVAFPSAVKPLFVGLTVAAYPIGCVVSNVVVAASYYLVFAPIGWLLRFFGRNPIERKFDRAAPSYWSPHETAEKSSLYFRQY